MGLFERLMLWAGFVRTSRVLDGITSIKEPAWRVSVGTHIFGRRYFEIAQQHLFRSLFDPSRVSIEDATLGFSKIAEAMRKLPSASDIKITTNSGGAGGPAGYSSGGAGGGGSAASEIIHLPPKTKQRKNGRKKHG